MDMQSNLSRTTAQASFLSALLSDFFDVFSDWESDWEIEGSLADDEPDGGINEYEASVRHRHLMKEPCYFRCRDDGKGGFEFEYHEDCWEPVAKEQVWRALWFDAMDR